MAADSYSRQCADLLEPVIAIALQAGQRILNIYQSDFSITRKKDESPVTEADYAAHHAIIDGLKALTPELPILSEESADIPFGERARWHCYWLVDPLDGTREFIKRNGEFTVNIALIEKHSPVLGVIHAPVSGINYYASRAGGAYKQEKPGTKPKRIRARPRRDTPVVAISRARSNSRQQLLLDRIGAHEVISVGSSLKSCLVAEGTADLYARLGPTSEWDTAAAQCIVEQAGGHITDTRMQPLRYNTKDSLLNPDFFVFGAGWYDWSKYL